MKRSPNRGSVYLGISGGLLVAAGAMFGAYLVTSHRDSSAHAANAPATPGSAKAAAASQADLDAALAAEVQVVAAGKKLPMRWSDLGAVVDPAEVGKTGRPLTLDREKALVALAALKAKVDRGAIDAFLDLEGKKVREETAGSGLDVLGSLPRLEAAVRTGATSVELLIVAVPARLTRANLGIDDISHVLGTYTTKFAVADKDRNFNLKLAASK